MLLKQPYDSRIFKHFDKSGLTYLVNRYIVADYPTVLQKGFGGKTYNAGNQKLNEVILTGAFDIETQIEQLSFPVIFPDKQWVLKDYRNFFSVNNKTGDIELKKTVAFPITKTRDDLITLWAMGLQKEMYHFKLPHLVFSKWISSLIVQRFGLDMNAELIIGCLALIYYARLFSNVRPEDEKELISVRFRDTMYTTGILDQVFEVSKEMETLEDFCAMISKVTGSVRLKDFNVAVLYRITQMSWMGHDYKNTLAVALEFPPLWIFMVLTSLTNNMYKKTNIGDRAETLGKRGEAQTFVKQIDLFLKENTGG